MTRTNRSPVVGLEDISDIINDVKMSRCFGKSARQLRLFEYLLKHSLDGTVSAVSQYSVAFDVLERPDSFDPTTDSIVRVELHRLRANLEIYNNSQSKYNITLPPASFEVIVSARKQGIFSSWKMNSVLYIMASLIALLVFGIGLASRFPSGKGMLKAAYNACSTVVPNILITYVGETSTAKNYAENVLRSTMTQQTGFNVLGGQQPCNENAAPVFQVQFTILEQDDLFNLALKVLDVDDNAIVESHHISGVVSEAKPDSALYYQLVEMGNSIAMPTSTLARFAYRDQWSSVESQKSYGCLIAMHDSYSGELEAEFENIHSCLEKSVKSGKASLDSYGALASSYLDQARNKRSTNVSKPLAAAQSILEEYGDKWIESNEMAIARLSYEADRPDFNAERLDLVLGSTQAKYSTNPQVLQVAATYYGYSLGRWEEAKVMSDDVKMIYAIRDQSIFGVDAGYALMHGSSADDIEACFRFYAENSIYVNILVQSCALSVKNQMWDDLTKVNLVRLNMSGVEEQISYLEERIRDRGLMDRVRSLLQAQENP